jgi:hypothetical protein
MPATDDYTRMLPHQAMAPDWAELYLTIVAMFVIYSALTIQDAQRLSREVEGPARRSLGNHDDGAKSGSGDWKMSGRAWIDAPSMVYGRGVGATRRAGSDSW